MDQKEIDELEPKYTGNQRDLTEGEAEAIVHDPNYRNEADDELGIDRSIANGLAYGIFRRT
ncbi:hypothetical protein [Paenibacillus sedimenti]|uniref:Uncharacterized protein n=1 Tax=Paenibacillus sedimenti TaxID=2770274 RepID=A0A926QIU0_9BACL|nr:hypothetical protein [Paenibacillus sedimenti]MBD0381011.1 hypothetical protein [Paenibacillus sedimenti]